MKFHLTLIEVEVWCMKHVLVKLGNFGQLSDSQKKTRQSYFAKGLLYHFTTKA